MRARKVAVIGTTGSGKTTFARRLADRLGVIHIELDALHHGPNWTEAPAEEFRESVAVALAAAGWVADGNYGGKLGDLVLERAELIVWLDPPFHTILRRLWRRTLDRVRNRTELWAGNRETWRSAFLSRDSLFLWALRTHFRRRRTLPARLARFEAVRLRSPEEADAWLERYV
jgi:adenylate kinase family enzyme